MNEQHFSKTIVILKRETKLPKYLRVISYAHPTFNTRSDESKMIYIILRQARIAGITAFPGLPFFV